MRNSIKVFTLFHTVLIAVVVGTHQSSSVWIDTIINRRLVRLAALRLHPDFRVEGFTVAISILPEPESSSSPNGLKSVWNTRPMVCINLLVLQFYFNATLENNGKVPAVSYADPPGAGMQDGDTQAKASRQIFLDSKAGAQTWASTSVTFMNGLLSVKIGVLF